MVTQISGGVESALQAPDGRHAKFTQQDNYSTEQRGQGCRGQGYLSSFSLLVKLSLSRQPTWSATNNALSLIFLKISPTPHFTFHFFPGIKFVISLGLSIGSDGESRFYQTPKEWWSNSAPGNLARRLSLSVRLTPIGFKTAKVVGLNLECYWSPWPGEGFRPKTVQNFLNPNFFQFFEGLNRLYCNNRPLGYTATRTTWKRC